MKSVAIVALLGFVSAESWYPCKDIVVKGYNDVKCTAPNRKLAF